jgi:enhancer of mRNA-decapping protein 4
MMGMLLGSVGVGGMSGINNSGMSGVGTAASNASLRVRTTSGSTSPSPIGSPSIVGYQKGRSASMDRAADTFGARLLSASVVMEEESSAVDAEVRQHNQQHAPEEHAANKAAASSSAKRTQEATLIQRLDQLFSRHFGRLSGLLAQERLELQQGERARFDALSASLVAAVNEGVEQSVQAGLRDALPLIVAEVGRAAAGSATTGGASNLSAEQVSEAVLSGLNEPLRQSFRTAFTSSLLPSFETAIKAMLAQVASSVASLNSASSSSGNKVAAEALALAQRSAAEAKQRAKEQAEAAKREQHAQAQLAEMTALVKSMAASQAALSESVADMKQQLRAAMAARPTAVTVGPPAAPSSPAQASAAPQPPPTPSSADAFAEVSSLLSQQLFEQAFTRALSSGKLPVVLSACRQIDARTLLTTTIPAHKLSSPVILSLCQQLAASLPGGAGGIVAAGGGATGASSLSDPDLTLKLVWLHECVLAIVPGDALIGAHVRPVLTEVLARLNALPRALVDPTTAPQHFVLVSMTAQAAQLKSA